MYLVIKIRISFLTSIGEGGGSAGIQENDGSNTVFGQSDELS